MMLRRHGVTQAHFGSVVLLLEPLPVGALVDALAQREDLDEHPLAAKVADATSSILNEALAGKGKKPPEFPDPAVDDDELPFSDG